MKREETRAVLGNIDKLLREQSQAKTAEAVERTLRTATPAYEPHSGRRLLTHLQLVHVPSYSGLLTYLQLVQELCEWSDAVLLAMGERPAHAEEIQVNWAQYAWLRRSAEAAYGTGTDLLVLLGTDLLVLLGAVVRVLPPPPIPTAYRELRISGWPHPEGEDHPVSLDDEERS